MNDFMMQKFDEAIDKVSSLRAELEKYKSIAKELAKVLDELTACDDIENFIKAAETTEKYHQLTTPDSNKGKGE